MENYYYENYFVQFTPDYGMSNFIKDSELENAEIVQMFQEDKINGFYEYQIIFKIKKHEI